MQLPLPFQLRMDAKLSDYSPLGNEGLMHHIKNLISKRSDKLLYIWGDHDFGKTHLLQAICHAVYERNETAIYLPLENHRTIDPKFVLGLESVDVICIDDVDAIKEDKEWQEAVFGLFNAILDNRKTSLVVSGQVPASSLTHILPDLRSRLSLCTTFKINELSEDAKMQLLRDKSMQRGLNLNKTVAEFILSRCSRTLPDLFVMLEKLDKASLAHQRRLTIPFVKEVLGI